MPASRLRRTSSIDAVASPFTGTSSGSTVSDTLPAVVCVDHPERPGRIDGVGAMPVERDGVPVPAGPGGVAGRARLWGALRACPDRTAAELAIAAGIGRSTAAKILAMWAERGHASAARGESARAARRWRAQPLTEGDPAPDDQPTEPDAGSPQERTPGGSPGALTTGSAARSEPLRRRRAGDARAPQRVASAADAKSASRGAVRPGRTRPARSGQFRLGAGQLRGMVADYLRDHPGEHSPVMIGAALRRSSGAVANALERLVEDGAAEQTHRQPKRYRGVYPDTDGPAPASAMPRLSAPRIFRPRNRIPTPTPTAPASSRVG